MPFKIKYTTTYKIPNPPDIRDFASAHVPSELEIAAAPELSYTPVLTMYLQGEAECSEMNKLSHATITETTDGIITEQTWSSEEEYSQSVISDDIRQNLATADISNTLRVYLRIKQLYYSEYIESVEITTETI